MGSADMACFEVVKKLGSMDGIVNLDANPNPLRPSSIGKVSLLELPGISI
jgi:hypothetical protein